MAERKASINTMKAIFFGDYTSETLNRVYPAHLIERLRETVDIKEDIIKKNEIANKKDSLKDVEYLFSTWGMPHCSEEEIRGFFPSLKAVFYGAGTVQEFARPFLNCGVKVFSAWAANAVPVAEYTTAQIILANKGFFQANSESPNDYKRASAYCGKHSGNYGAKVGLIGVGVIGSLVAQMLRAYHLETLVFDPFLSDEKACSLGVRKTTLEEIFESCTVVSNHLANNEKTAGMLNYRLFSKMLPLATFINTGRGRQVVENDLIRALKEEAGRTAVLDVTFPEPPWEGHEFYTMKNVILTPHIAGSFGDETARMGLYMCEEFEALTQGRQLRFEVTLGMLETMA